MSDYFLSDDDEEHEVNQKQKFEEVKRKNLYLF